MAMQMSPIPHDLMVCLLFDLHPNLPQVRILALVLLLHASIITTPATKCPGLSSPRRKSRGGDLGNNLRE